MRHHHPPAIHHSIVVTDTENFTDPARTNLDQVAIRQGIYKVIRRAFTRSRIDWNSCAAEDRGDGILVLVPSDVPKIKPATGMLRQLETALVNHNASCRSPARIRLRIALHAGEVYHDSHGVTGTAINQTFRLIAMHAFKAVHSPGPLAVIVSQWFHDEVINHDPAAEPGSYHRVPDAPAWVRRAAFTTRGGDARWSPEECARSSQEVPAGH